MVGISESGRSGNHYSPDRELPGIPCYVRGDIPHMQGYGGDVMKIFSDELRILDENTVMNMIDEMREKNEQMKTELQSMKASRNNPKDRNQDLRNRNQALKDWNQNLEEQNQNLQTELAQLDERIALLELQSKENRRLYEEMAQQLEDLRQKLANPNRGAV